MGNLPHFILSIGILTSIRAAGEIADHLSLPDSAAFPAATAERFIRALNLHPKDPSPSTLLPLMFYRDRSSRNRSCSLAYPARAPSRILGTMPAITASPTLTTPGCFTFSSSQGRTRVILLLFG
ncbi:hypothetical protein KSP40_PGU021180 [Platanthera guangdongensis]|uniref:Uncharacterized protein n=1 Tax=Platanthera guangdongensis TaxID=2320717 RepID=A0ABR2M188_9ASPA